MRKACGAGPWTSDLSLSLPQPVHSPSPTGFCGVGPVTSPGPLLSPGSSSASNGGDAEGPGPPAPVSASLPLHPFSPPSPCSRSQHCQAQRSLVHLLFFLVLLSSLIVISAPPHWGLLLALSPGLPRLATPPQCCPLPCPTGDLPADL